MSNVETRTVHWKRAVAFVLALVMVLGMLPGEMTVVRAAVDYGTVQALMFGGTVNAEDTSAVVVTYSGVTLEDTAGENEAGAWQLGIKVTAPEKLNQESDFINEQGAVKIEKQNEDCTWTEVGQFWDLKVSKDDDTVHYVELMGEVTAEKLVAAAAAQSNLTYQWRFDWDHDGEFEQTVTMSIAPSGVVLKLNGTEVFPATLGYGSLTPASDGAEQSGDTITYRNVSLEWLPVDESLGRTETGWWVGMKMTAPASLLTAADCEKAVYQTKGSNGWSESRKFWDDQDSDKNAESAARHLTLWGLVDVAKLQGRLSENGLLTYSMRFDWDGDGIFEQTAVMNVDAASVVLMKEGVEQYPATKGYGTYSALCDGAVMSDNVITYENVSLIWEPADESLGRTKDGWWLGVKMTAPAGMIKAEDFAGAKVRLGEKELMEVSFWDSKETDDDAAEHFITMWGYVDQEKLKAAGDGSITYSWEFDWDGDGLFEQDAKMKIKADTVKLMKDGFQIWPVVYKQVNVQQEGSGTVTVNGETVANGGHEDFIQNHEVTIKVEAAEGSYISALQIGSESIGTVKGTTSYEKTLKPSEDVAVVVVFTPKHTVTFEGGNGSFRNADGKELNTVTAAYGETLSFTYEAALGFGLSAVKCDGEVLTAVDGKYTITVTGDMTITAETKDVEAPTAKNPSVSDPNKWTREKTVTVYVNDNVGVDKVLWSANADGSGAKKADIDGTKATFTVEDALGEDGKVYYIWVYDAEGNESTRTDVTVRKIDRVGPTIGAVENNYGFNSRYLRVDATDSESGVAAVYFTLDPTGQEGLHKADYDPLLWLPDYKYETTDFKGYYYVFAVDHAGNWSSNASSGIDPDKKDQAGPAIDSILLNGNSLEDEKVWTSGDVTVTFDATDDSGVDVVYWFTENPGKEPDTAKGQELTEVSSDPAPDTKFKSYSITVSENKSYYIYAVDQLGNGRVVEVKVDIIDRTEPVVVAEPQVQVGEDWNIISGWTNQDVTVWFYVDDHNQSGIENVYYTTTAPVNGEIPADAFFAELLAANDDGYYVASFTIKDEVNVTYYYWTVDKVGNKSTIGQVTVQIDKTAPQNVSFTYNNCTTFVGGTYDCLYNTSPVSVILSAEDNASGICAVFYQISGNEEWIDCGAFSDGKMDLDHGLEITFDNSFEGTIQYKVVDRAGNETLIDGTTKIVVDLASEPKDIGAVQVEKTIDDDSKTLENGWTNGDVTFVISGGETISGVDHYEYQVWTMNEDGSYPVEPKADAPWNQLSERAAGPEQKDGEGKIRDELVLKLQTAAMYRFRAVTNTGAVSEASEWYEVKIQTAPHKQAIVSDFDQLNWYNTLPDISIEPNKDNLANQAPVQYEWQLWNETKGESLEDAVPIEIDKFNQSYFQDKDGNWVDGIYKLKVYSTNGFESLGTEYTIRFDASAPTIQNINLISLKDGKHLTENVLVKPDMGENSTSVATGFTRFYGSENLIDGSIKVELMHDTRISGTKKVEYQLVERIADKNDEKWLEYNLGFLIPANRKVFVCVRITDYAGNVTEAISEGIITDDKVPSGNAVTEAPEIQINLPQAPASGIYTDDVLFNINVFDPKFTENVSDAENGNYSGLMNVTYEIFTQEADGTEVTTKAQNLGGTKNTDGDGLVHNWFQNDIKIDSAMFDSNNIYIRVIAEDNAGNARTTTVGPIKIDVTKPKIAVSYSDSASHSGVFYQGKRTATIVVTERNFDPANTIVTVMKDERAYPVELAWSQNVGKGNCNDTTNTAVVTFTEDGDYTFAIQALDLAGLANEGVSYAGGNEQAFTIDNTAPTVSVSYDNNTVVNETYFANKRVATITIVEHNFDSNLVEVALTASFNGAAITKPAVSRWNSGSGDRHTATIVYDADGDYTFDIHVKDLAQNADNGANYGGSKAPKAFTVDTTIVEPTIGGVEDGHAYQNEVQPEITVNDENFSNYTVELLRTRLGEKNVDVTKDFFNLITLGEEGGTLLTDEFPHAPEYDGIYTLTVTMTDKAGNTSSKVTTFTVNRFGSVYAFEDYLVSLVSDGGSYVPEVTEDLVLTEYNADKLIEDSIRVVISRDGHPVDDVSFTVDPKADSNIEVGDSGWYQYLYTISKDNFAQDGIYEISITSRDATGNNPGNTNYTDKIIRFRVDSTAPEIISITGLEESIVNATEVEVGYMVYDSIGLKSVTIYVDGQVYGDVITDFEDGSNYEGSFILNESDNAQHVRIVVEDMSGNIIDTDASDFVSAYEFNDQVTISTNWFVRWFANKPLFFGSIAGGIGLAALLWFLIFGKRKKEEEEEQNVQ